MLFAFVEFFVDLELLHQRVGVFSNPTDVGVVLVCSFLLTPVHYDAAELGVRVGQALACQQAVVVKEEGT